VISKTKIRNWIWVVLLILVTAIAVVIGRGLFQPHSSPISESKVETSTNVVVSEQPVSAPDVSPEQLFGYVKALNFRRYTEAERDRTRTYLTQSLKKLGWTPTLQSFEGGVNIFAQQQGTDPAAGSILVAAHYDTVPTSPGADDNASGVAVVLEVARLFGSRPTPRTLQLAFFDQEELGMRGSRAFVANKTHLENLHGVIVLDMVGFACYTAGCQKYPAGLPIVPPTDRGDFLAVVGDMEHLPLLNAFQQSGQESLPPAITLPVPLKGMLIPDTLRSDHAPFWYSGVGAVLLTDTANLRTPHYHQPSDTPATLDQPFFSGVAQIVVNATTRLLESRERLETEPSTSPPV
jgi:Zn-dependent M28 family amino/carboxypeptidase